MCGQHPHHPSVHCLYVCETPPLSLSFGRKPPLDSLAQPGHLCEIRGRELKGHISQPLAPLLDNPSFQRRGGGQCQGSAAFGGGRSVWPSFLWSAQSRMGSLRSHHDSPSPNVSGARAEGSTGQASHKATQTHRKASPRRARYHRIQRGPQKRQSGTLSRLWWAWHLVNTCSRCGFTRMSNRRAKRASCKLAVLCAGSPYPHGRGQPSPEPTVRPLVLWLEMPPSPRQPAQVPPEGDSKADTASSVSR